MRSIAQFTAGFFAALGVAYVATLSTELHRAERSRDAAIAALGRVHVIIVKVTPPSTELPPVYPGGLRDQEDAEVSR